jgi:hypothetical protein
MHSSLPDGSRRTASIWSRKQVALGASPEGAAVIAPSRLVRLEREVRSYLATTLSAGSQTGLSRLKQRFVG